MELRLPIKVLRRAPFIYVGADSRFLILGALSDLVTFRGLNLQRAYPLLVSKRSPGGLKAGRLFSLAFLYVDDNGGWRLHLTHPVLLGDEEGALEILLSRAYHLASSLGCTSMDIEVHKASGSVSFPSSLSPLFYDLNKATLVELEPAFFLKRGFRVAEEIKCLNAEIDDFEEGLNIEKGSNEHISHASPSEFRDIERKCKAFSIRSYALSMADATFNPGENIPFYEGAAYIMWGRRWGSRERRVDGFLRWSPNLFEALERVRTPHLLFFQHPMRWMYRTGKVFEWGFRTREKRIILHLLSAATEAMRSRGIETVELGYMDSGQGFLERVLGEHSFKVVHRITLLRRVVEH